MCVCKSGKRCKSTSLDVILIAREITPLTCSIDGKTTKRLPVCIMDRLSMPESSLNSKRPNSLQRVFLNCSSGATSAIALSEDGNNVDPKGSNNSVENLTVCAWKKDGLNQDRTPIRDCAKRQEHAAADRKRIDPADLPCPRRNRERRIKLVPGWPKCASLCHKALVDPGQG